MRSFTNDTKGRQGNLQKSSVLMGMMAPVLTYTGISEREKFLVMFWGPLIISPENQEMKVPCMGMEKEEVGRRPFFIAPQ